MKKHLIPLLVFIFATTTEAIARQWAPSEVKEIIRKANTYWQTNNSAKASAFWDNAAYHTGNVEVYNKLWMESGDGSQDMLDYSIPGRTVLKPEP